ncbi:unnamed protein product [Adineta steineri]|uniref:Uncharacterized protein n=1 Tax=Adineta steineri TaxID=433720 RepID=A0A814MDZ3_9BILA|nr:unnamed protein product [Adineta steineri]CAF3898167.1 unnamed protein product [Adineta steineri]
MLRLLILFCLFGYSSLSLPYAEWAHYHMVWLPNSHTNQADIQAMFDNYLEHRILVGIVNIDFRWATNVNTFIFNPTRFPSPKEMLDGFRQKGMHIVLWMNSGIDIDSPNYQYAQDHGYLFNKTIDWGHGHGRLLNYFNLDAVNWWHSQIKQLIDTVGPIHAFKADYSDLHIIEMLDPEVTWLKYRTAYYNDTFHILRQLIGQEALIMSRPVDYDLDFSPHDIVFMGWVGDEEGTYDGLRKALRYMLESGRRHYVGFGSDIGGYDTDSKAGPLGRTKELFLRWAAVGALSSFMENGGGGEHLPWKFDNETTNIYRSWVELHYMLVPYLYAEGTKAATIKNSTLMRPCDDIEAIFSYAYFLGPHIYVVPILRNPAPNQTQRIWLPSSPSGKWLNGFNTSIEHKAHTSIDEDTSRLDRIPMYIQSDSLIPMYDTEYSQSLDAFKFVLWGEGKSIQRKISVSLFTRDGQEWLLELDVIRQRLSTRFVRMHNSIKQSQQQIWTWKFCQYIHEQQRCTTNWKTLDDGAWIQVKLHV